MICVYFTRRMSLRKVIVLYGQPVITRRVAAVLREQVLSYDVMTTVSPYVVGRALAHSQSKSSLTRYYPITVLQRGCKTGGLALIPTVVCDTNCTTYILNTIRRHYGEE
jgi:hypothetical protein